MNSAPIAIYDSGLGGLTVWREVRRALPGESLPSGKLIIQLWA